MNKEDLWQAALAQLQFHISPANFATWFKNTYILTQKDGQLVISVPNNFSKEWLENKYHKVIFRILRDLDGGTKEIKYMVGGLPQKARTSTPREAPAVSIESQLDFQELKVDRTTNLNPRYTFDSFIVGPFNELAHASSLAIVKNPGTVYNPLFVYGGVGLGKTHLLQALGNKISKDLSQKSVRYMSSERFTTEVVAAIRNHTVDNFRALYREFDVLIIDDVQFLAGKEKTQEELFHTFNALYDKGHQIVFSSDRPPKAIPALEERLRSRFEGGMTADISMPDFETRMAILKTKAEERNITLDAEVSEYIVSHIQRNIRELEGALNRVLAYYRLHDKIPNIAEAKPLLRAIIQSPSKLATPKRIIQVVAEFYDLKERELLAASRKKEIVRPRQIAMYLLREELKYSYPLIGKKDEEREKSIAAAEKKRTRKVGSIITQ